MATSPGHCITTPSAWSPSCCWRGRFCRLLRRGVDRAAVADLATRAVFGGCRARRGRRLVRRPQYSRRTVRLACRQNNWNVFWSEGYDSSRRRDGRPAPSADTPSRESTATRTWNWSGCGCLIRPKVGKDAGRLAGLDRDLGVVATNDKQALLDLKPDAIVHRDDRRSDLRGDRRPHRVRPRRRQRRLLGPGPAAVPVRRSARSGDRPDHRGREEGGATLHVNGIDPGFANVSCRWP